MGSRFSVCCTFTKPEKWPGGLWNAFMYHLTFRVLSEGGAFLFNEAQFCFVAISVCIDGSGTTFVLKLFRGNLHWKVPRSDIKITSKASILYKNHIMKRFRGRGCKASLIHGGEWSASRFGHGRASSTHCIGGWWYTERRWTPPLLEI
jgi:hypothetical protein